jgi:TPR repeat protein
MAFRYGLGVKANQELARYWLRKSAKNHYTHAQRIFKTYYAKKRVIRQYRFASAIDY